jgi:diguanylate cyclase (GGDEF)-like protein
MKTQLGIRSTLYLGLGAMLAVVVFVALAALIATSRISDSASEIVDVRLPQTIETLRVARAADAVLAAGARVVLLVIDPHRSESLHNTDEVMLSLANARQDFEQTAARFNHVPELANRVASNLDRLQQMVHEHLALERRRTRLREQLLLNLQSFQEHLTHRVRVLQSDGDVITLLMARESPNVTRIAGIARGMTASLSSLHFYSEIEAIHGRLQSAGQDQSETALELSRSVLHSRFTTAQRIYNELPGDVAPLITPAFNELEELINSDQGLLAQRRAELNLFNEGQQLLEENRVIGMQIDSATRSLVGARMQGIAEAGKKASETRSTYVISMVTGTLIGLAGLAALMYFQIHRRLVRRLGWLSHAMQQVAAGQVETPLPPAGDDELGRLGNALRQFRATEVAHRQQEDKLRESNQRAAKALGALEQANRKLAELSTRDGLTGLANRRHFDESLQIEKARAAHAHRPLALLMIDVDYFKNYNDRFGHQAGDECLRQIATAIQSCARRASDVVARYGGEEFCVISAYTDAASSQELADSILHAVRSLAIPHASTPAGIVTVSIGYAVAKEVEGLTAENLLRAADQALYAAKAQGRNRTAQGIMDSMDEL